jgi:hypothetical protein
MIDTRELYLVISFVGLVLAVASLNSSPFSLLREDAIALLNAHPPQ